MFESLDRSPTAATQLASGVIRSDRPDMARFIWGGVMDALRAFAEPIVCNASLIGREGAGRQGAALVCL